MDHHELGAAPEAVLQERWERAKAIEAAFRELGRRTLLEDSNGNGGYDIWVVFSEPVSTALVYALVAVVRHQIGGEGIETYPKQARISEGKLGNWIRVFGKHHDGREHWSRIWNGESA